MLDRIREKSRSPITWVIFGAIIVVFIISFGPGSGGFGGSNGLEDDAGYAAKVNGDEIPTREFRAAYENTYRQYQQQMGEQFSPEMADQLGLRDRVLDGLVERDLLLDAARAQGLSVSDEEVAQAIREIPAFQNEGRFDFAHYKRFVELSLGQSTDAFEETVREDLLRQKVIAQLRQSAKVTDEEVRTEYVRDTDRANVAFVRLTGAQFRSDAALSDADVQAYLATDAGKKAVEEEYKRQAFRFKKPKQVKAQHILVKVAEGAPEADVEAARAKVAEAKQKIEGGADFAAIAKELSEDPGSKESGGDLGFFGPGQMVKPFEEAAFALEPGQLSDPVRSRFGFHLIKVNEVKPPEEKALADVQVELARELIGNDRAKAAARAEAEKIRTQLAAGKKLTELYPKPEVHTADDGHGHGAELPPADPNRIVAEETGTFALSSDYVPRIGVSADIVRDASAATAAGQPLGIYDVQGNWVVAQLVERSPADMQAFPEKQPAYRARVLQKKQEALVEGFVKKLREGATVETNPAIFAAAPAAE